MPNENNLGTLDDVQQEALASLYDSTGAVNPEGLANTQAAMQDAGQQVRDTSKPNTALRTLQEAIRAKTGSKQAPLGESEIFKGAGVSGMGALSASLNTRAKEIKINQAEFSNIIGQMAGTYKDMGTQAINNYNMIAAEYNTAVGRMQKLEDDATNQEQAIELLQVRHDLDKELAGFKNSFKGSGNGADGDFPKGFWTAIRGGVASLQKGEPWGTVYDRLKLQFPDVDNDRLDKALGGGWKAPTDEAGLPISSTVDPGENWGWAVPGAFEAWKKKQYKEPQDRKFEIESNVWRWLGSEEAINMSDEEKFLEIQRAGFNPEDFGIY